MMRVLIKRADEAADEVRERCKVLLQSSTAEACEGLARAIRAIPGHMSIDGNGAKECVLATLAMKPGDTDADYFANYTNVQLAFSDAFAEDLYMLKCERYGEG